MLTAHESSNESSSTDEVGILVHAVNNSLIRWPVGKIPGCLEGMT